MEEMDHGMNMAPPPPPPPSSSSSSMNGMHDKMTMHMTFFWGSNSEILFSGWPGSRTGMYVLALIFVFVLAAVVEWLSHCRFVKQVSDSAPDRVRAGLVQTLLHALRLGLAYIVMLAVMSFNAGVFLVAVAGHTVGFLVFGSAVFKKGKGDKVASDLPPMSC